MRFNTRREVFPSNLIANFFNFDARDFFLVAESAKSLPRVDLKLPA
jgi:hypothetical protein